MFLTWSELELSHGRALKDSVKRQENMVLGSKMIRFEELCQLYGQYWMNCIHNLKQRMRTNLPLLA